MCALALPGRASHCARGGCVYVNFVLGTYCIVVSGPCQLHLLPYRVAGSVRLVHELFFLFLLLRVSLCAGAGVLGGAVYVWMLATKCSRC